jgi:CSLREA domain-containing protein
VISIAVVAACAVPTTAWAATYTPTRTDDPAPGACAAADCSLREAISAANARSGPDVVRLTSGKVYSLQRAGRIEDSNRTGDLDVNHDPIELADTLTIETTGSALATIDANGLDRVIDGYGDLTLDRLRIREGSVPGDGGGIYHGCCGKLTISNSQITDNEAAFGAGGVYSFTSSGSVSIVRTSILRNSVPGDLGGAGGFGEHGPSPVTISSSTIAENHGAYGGGIGTRGGPLTLVNSRVLNNSATAHGGGIFNWGDHVEGSTLGDNTKVTVTRSLIFGNSANGDPSQGLGLGGGGIATLAANTDATTIVSGSTISFNSSNYNAGGIGSLGSGGIATLRMTNSTVANNEAADFGGGIDSFAFDGAGSAAHVSLNAVTVAYNDANSDGDGTGQGGGLQNGAPRGRFSVANSLIAGNTALVGPDCAGFPFTSGGHNLRTRGSACAGFSAAGDLVNSAPRIGTLADNGGPTETIALLGGSPAIGAAGTSSPAADQRGVARDSAPDIGAYEVR